MVSVLLRLRKQSRLIDGKNVVVKQYQRLSKGSPRSIHLHVTNSAEIEEVGLLTPNQIASTQKKEEVGHFLPIRMHPPIEHSTPAKSKCFSISMMAK